MTSIVTVTLEQKCTGKNVDVILKDGNGNETKAHTLRNGRTDQQAPDYWKGSVYDGQEVVVREVNE